MLKKTKKSKTTLNTKKTKKKKPVKKEKKDVETLEVLRKTKDAQLARQVQLQNLMNEMKQEIEQNQRNTLSFDSMSNLSQIKDIYELTKKAFKHQTGKGVKTDYQKQQEKEDKMAIKMRELEIKVKNARARRQKEKFYNYSKVKLSQCYKHSGALSSKENKASTLLNLKLAESLYASNLSRKDKDKIVKFKKNALDTIKILKEKTQTLIGKVNSKLEKYSETNNNTILEGLKEREGYEKIFDDLSENGNMLKVYQGIKNTEKLLYLNKKESEFISKRLSDCAEEDLLLGDFIELLERKENNYLINELYFRDGLFSLKRKCENFHLILNSFEMDWIDFLAKLNQKNNFEVFQRIEVSKLEISSFVSFFTETLQSYFKLSYNKLVDVKEDIGKKYNIIEEKFEELEDSQFQEFNNNFQKFKDIKANIVEFDDYKSKKTIKNGDFIGNKLSKMKEDNTKFKKLLPDTFYDYQKTELIVDNIKNNIVRDQKIRLIQQYVRRWRARKYKNEIRFVFIVNDKLEKNLKRHAFKNLLSIN